MKKKGFLNFGTVAAIAAVSIIGFTSTAKADEIIYETSSDEIIQYGGYGTVDSSEQQTVVEKRYLASANKAVLSAEDVIYAGLLAGQDRIDISLYNMTAEEVKAAYVNTLNKHADLFYVSNGWGTSQANGKILAVYPSYTMTVVERTEAQQEFNSEIEIILSGVEDSWTDVEKLLYIHDYMCTHYEYDTNYAIYDAYNMIKYKKGVCQAYTELYGYLAGKIGVEWDIVTSNAMNHIWNEVEIDNKWYQIDVTWDDPIADLTGRARHIYFLKSEANMASEGIKGHHDWVSDNPCVSTSYDSAFWNDIDSSFANVNNTWYCLDTENRTLNECNLNNLTIGDELYSLEYWYLKGGSYYSGAYSGLASYDGILYFNSSKSLVSYNPATQKAEVVHTPTLANGVNIYGSVMDENMITYVTGEDPYKSVLIKSTYTIPLDINDIEVTVEGEELICKGDNVKKKDIEYNLGAKKAVIVRTDNTIVLDTEYVGTGDTIFIYGTNESLMATYTFVLKGDATGDAVIDVMDMEGIQKHILGLAQLTGVYLEAAQLNESDTISVMDMESIQKKILGIQ